MSCVVQVGGPGQRNEDGPQRRDVAAGQQEPSPGGAIVYALNSYHLT